MNISAVLDHDAPVPVDIITCPFVPAPPALSFILPPKSASPPMTSSLLDGCVLPMPTCPAAIIPSKLAVVATSRPYWAFVLPIPVLLLSASTTRASSPTSSPFSTANFLFTDAIYQCAP